MNDHVTALFGLPGFQVLSAENVDGEWHLGVADTTGPGWLRRVRGGRPGQRPPDRDGPGPAHRRDAGAPAMA